MRFAELGYTSSFDELDELTGLAFTIIGGEINKLANQKAKAKPIAKGRRR